MSLQSLRKPYFSKVQFCRHPEREPRGKGKKIEGRSIQDINALGAQHIKAALFY